MGSMIASLLQSPMMTMKLDWIWLGNFILTRILFVITYWP